MSSFENRNETVDLPAFLMSEKLRRCKVSYGQTGLGLKLECFLPLSSSNAVARESSRTSS